MQYQWLEERMIELVELLYKSTHDEGDWTRQFDERANTSLGEYGFRCAHGVVETRLKEKEDGFERWHKSMTVAAAINLALSTARDEWMRLEHDTFVKSSRLENGQMLSWENDSIRTSVSYEVKRLLPVIVWKSITPLVGLLATVDTNIEISSHKTLYDNE